MAQRTVVWTKTADVQFVGVLEFWVKKNKSANYSKKLIQIVSEATQLIAERPFMYKATDFKDTRVASLGNYSIYYKFTDTQIIISAFWDNRQDHKKLLEILQFNT
jgi:toxin YoeB